MLSREAMQTVIDLGLERDALRQRVATLEKALKPFAAAVYNDNGDVTISGVDCEHYMRARKLVDPFQP